MTIQNYIKQKQQHIETVLTSCLPSEQTNSLYKAMHYTVLSTGKRFRPLLVYATGESLGYNGPLLDKAAGAVEFIHSSSLVHDDLPAMDDDDLRHGKLSCHKAFGEAIAILTGDALLSLAFEVLGEPITEADPIIQLKLVYELGHASGDKGMVLGQALDMMPEEITSIAALEKMHFHKTGALIQASVLMGAIAANCLDQEKLEHLSALSQYLGLAYQIQDDILDLESSTEHLGKPSKSDLKNDKQTYPVLAGIENAKKQAEDLYHRALSHLKAIHLDNSRLAELVIHFLKRDK